MDGRASEPVVAALLMGLAMKGERPGEIVGFARAMRERAVAPTVGRRGVVDMCGTGGDRAGTFNISSMAALVVAACGVPVAKHGNRSVEPVRQRRRSSRRLACASTLRREARERLLDEPG